LFRVFRDENGKLITPNTQGDDLINRVIDKKYYYFYPQELKNTSSLEDITPSEVSKIPLSYKYKPKFNEGAEKVRTVSLKESNAFNNLQTLAETFGVWLALEVERDENGKISQKKAVFKNYSGESNQAGFRYGVNLNDIQRTRASKEIVTKLIV
jgi:phage minor structural protein